LLLAVQKFPNTSSNVSYRVTSLWISAPALCLLLSFAAKIPMPGIAPELPKT